YAVEELGLDRVLIIDWDVHHGQATQYEFYEDPRVLYLSIHRYDNGDYWPNLRESNFDFIGKKPAVGFNVNIPINDRHLTDIDYLTIFNRLVMPLAYEFNPQLVLVSAGFDCAYGCHFGEFHLTPSIFAYLTHLLMPLASGKLVLALEGGYNLDSLSQSVCHCVSALLRHRLPPLDAFAEIRPSTLETIANCVSVLRPYWKLLTVYPVKDMVPLQIGDLPTRTWEQVRIPAVECEQSKFTQEEVQQICDRLSEMRVKLGASLTPVLVYDVGMERHQSPEHNDHPERPLRTWKIWNELQNLCQSTRKLMIYLAGVGAAVVRPPGHHACADRAMGFCFFNNVAVAARHAQKKFQLQRVLIVDWDVHHGNGTQDIFDQDPSVLYFSVHRYDHGRFYPQNEKASAEYCGSGPGEGKSVNVAWNSKPVGDAEYICTFFHVLLPIVLQFRPQLILVSAGFDAVRGDTLGGLQISPECFGHLTHILSTVAFMDDDSKGLVLALEGGYHVSRTAQSMAFCVQSLLNDLLPPLEFDTTAPSAKTCAAIQCSLNKQAVYWRYLAGYDPIRCLCLKDKMRTFVSPDRSKSRASPGPTDSPKTRSMTRKESIDSLSESFANVAIHNSMFGNIRERTVNNTGEGDECRPSGSLEAPNRIEVSNNELREFLGINASTSEEAELPSQMFAVAPLSWCPHLEEGCMAPPMDWVPNVSGSCSLCEHQLENWVCLTCYRMFCGSESGHALVLSIADLSSWCYACDAYVHHPCLLPPKRILYRVKFNEEMSA
ncbi:Histone deacetylase 6, partial [Cichlidogyrus casuarinus]